MKEMETKREREDKVQRKNENKQKDVINGE